MLIVIAVVSIVATVGRGLLVAPSDAVSAAESAGYSDVTVTSSQWLFPGFAGCDSGDADGALPQAPGALCIPA